MRPSRAEYSRLFASVFCFYTNDNKLTVQSQRSASRAPPASSSSSFPTTTESATTERMSFLGANILPGVIVVSIKRRPNYSLCAAGWLADAIQLIGRHSRRLEVHLEQQQAVVAATAVAATPTATKEATQSNRSLPGRPARTDGRLLGATRAPPPKSQPQSGANWTANSNKSTMAGAHLAASSSLAANSVHLWLAVRRRHLCDWIRLDSIQFNSIDIVALWTTRKDLTWRTVEVN